MLAEPEPAASAADPEIAEETPRPSWLRVARQRDVVLRSVRVAVVVGTVLVAIHYANRLLAGELTGRDWIKMAIPYLVPFCVSTHASVSALRGPFIANATTRRPPSDR